VGEGGRSAMAGPVYYHDDFKVAEKRFPRYYDGKLIIYEWMRNWVMAVTMDAEGNLEKIEPFLASMNFAKPVDMQFGKDGALYVLEYGTYWSSQNADSKLSKIEFWEGNRPPVARVIASRTVGRAPLTVKFSSEGTFDHDPGDRLTYAWSFTGTNQVHSNDPNPSFTFDKPGVYRPRLTVSDARGAQATAQVEISVGNEAPEIAFALTGNRTFYWDGRKVNYEVMVTDAEDGSLDKGISPEDVTVTLDYLPQGKDLIGVVQGHQEAATASGSPGTGKVLIENSDCKACHALDRKSVGPAYQEIARRYKDDSKAVHTLATKIIKGGSGNWGDHAMSAHPQLSETDAREMVRYILALEDTKNRMPVRGSFTARSAASDAGKYILSASYTDTGGAETGPLTTRKELVLRPAKVSASGYDEARGVARKNDPENNRPFLRFSEHGSFIVFNGVDLSGISQLTLRVSSNQLPGTMEVRLGSPEGTLIGQVKVIPGGKWHELSAPLVPTNGEHDVYVVYVYDEGPAEKVTIWNTVNLEWIHFHPANAL
jgi:cytochrome c